MDAASSEGSSLLDSAQGKEPQPSASDPTRVSVPLSSPAPKASGKSLTPPAGYAPKRSEAAQVRQPKVEGASPSSPEGAGVREDATVSKTAGYVPAHKRGGDGGEVRGRKRVQMDKSGRSA